MEFRNILYLITHQEKLLDSDWLRDCEFISSIALGGTGALFHMMDQCFSNDLLEPFESIFIGSTGLAMAFRWLCRPREYGGTGAFFNMMALPAS